MRRVGSELHGWKRYAVATAVWAGASCGGGRASTDDVQGYPVDGAPKATAASTTDSEETKEPSTASIIEQLAMVSDEGIGFSATTTGSAFLPSAESDQVGMVLLGEPPPRRSPLMTLLVKRGAGAVPSLLACMADDTLTKIPAVKPMMWSSSPREYDFNRRTGQPPIEGLNLEDETIGASGHQIRVGDLCFVALGQIVNRNFAAIRYQPTGGLIVSSPPLDPEILRAARTEWGGLDEAQHRASLRADFEQPDYPMRREQAMLRLGYYYPELAQTLAKSWRESPTYDPIEVSSFAELLYGLAGPARRAAYETFAAEEGEAGRDGLRQVLFEDLSSQEAFEEKRVSPPDAGSDVRARECLVELFDEPPTVRATDRPYPVHESVYDRRRWVEAAKAVGITMD